MNRKKIICMLVSISLCLASYSSVFAGDIKSNTTSSAIGQGTLTQACNISEDTAKQTFQKVLKDYFSIDVNSKKYEENIRYENYYDTARNVWNISFSKNDNNNYSYINGIINADNGKILKMFSDNEDDDIKPESTVVTKKEALNTACNFIKNIAPIEYSQVKLDNNNLPFHDYGNQYYFNFVRDVNGIPFYKSNINVLVNMLTGKVTQYSYNWDEGTVFPDTVPQIDKNKAYELFKNKINMKPQYITYKNNYNNLSFNNPPIIKLVYCPDFNGQSLLDASSGNFINDEYDNIIEKADMSADEKEEWLKNSKPLQKVDVSESVEAKNIIKSYIKDLYGDNYEIESIEYNNEDSAYKMGSRKMWTAQFYDKNSDKPYKISNQISIDSSTGRIINIYNFEDEEEFSSGEPKVTWKDSYKKALSILAKYFPDKIQYLNTEQLHEDDYLYTNSKNIKQSQNMFNFKRMVNGIEFRDNSIRISFDEASGKLYSINYDWDETAAFPSIQGIMESGKVKDMYLNNANLGLEYDVVKNTSSGSLSDNQIKLVYAVKPDNYINIDAANGKFLDYDGNEGSVDMVNFEKAVKGSAVEKQAIVLAAQGIISTENFDINKKITKDDMIKAFVNLKEKKIYISSSKDLPELLFTNVKRSDANYRYLQKAVKYGILQNGPVEYNGNENMTREGMAVAVIKLMGYENAASIKNIYVLNCVDSGDVMSDDVGYVALSSGMNIISSDNGKFRPKDDMTMEEFIKALYGALYDMKN